jgi:hypothetical protein
VYWVRQASSGLCWLIPREPVQEGLPMPGTWGFQDAPGWASGLTQTKASGEDRSPGTGGRKWCVRFPALCQLHSSSTCQPTSRASHPRPAHTNSAARRHQHSCVLRWLLHRQPLHWREAPGRQPAAR